MITGIFLLVLVIILGLLFPKSKMVTFLIMLYMWVLFAFNTQSPDRAAYEYAYSNINSARFFRNYEIAFSLLMLICKNIGLTYTAFRALLATIYVVITYATVRAFTQRTAYALALFIVAPFLWYVSGLRAAIASAVVGYSMHFLLRRDKQAKVYFCLGIGLATLFHYSSLLYIILLLGNKRRIKWGNLLAITTLATIASVVVTRTNILYSIVSIFTDRTKILKWFNTSAYAAGRPNLTGSAVLIILLIGNVYITSWAEKRCLNSRMSTDSQRSCTVFVSNVNKLMFLMLPLLMLNQNFFRIIQGIQIVNICTCANMADIIYTTRAKRRILSNGRGKVAIISLMIIIWSFVYAIYQEKPYIFTDNSVIHIITKNSLFFY